MQTMSRVGSILCIDRPQLYEGGSYNNKERCLNEARTAPGCPMYDLHQCINSYTCISISMQCVHRALIAEVRVHDERIPTV